MAVAAIAACKNPYYCEGYFEDNCRSLDADPCAACGGATPICSPELTCRACSTHAECPASDTCLPDGSCAAPADVAYVRPGALGNTCTRELPCPRLQLAIDTDRPFVRLAAGKLEANTATVIDGKTVTIIGDPGAVLDRSTDGAIVLVKGSSLITISDVVVTGSTGTEAAIDVQDGTPTVTLRRVTVRDNKSHGISAANLEVIDSIVAMNGGIGITSSSALRIRGTRIERNAGMGVQFIDPGVGSIELASSRLVGNGGGGVSISTGGPFVVIGNLFYANGTTGTAGGATVAGGRPSGSRLEFNTLTRNAGPSGSGLGIRCLVNGFLARNNLVYANGAATEAQVAGACAHTHSDIGPAGVADNLSVDPMFSDEMTGHVRPNSVVRGKADPSSDLSGVAARDLDGDPRVAPADIGADQVP